MIRINIKDTKVLDDSKILFIAIRLIYEAAVRILQEFDPESF